MLTIVIPTYNEEDFIGSLLDQINNQKDPEDEIIIVDGYSNDKTAQIAKEKGAIVVLQEKQGIGLAKTEGSKHAKNELLVHLDADCRIDPGFLRRIKDHFQNKDLVALCGLDLYSSNSRVWRFLYNLYSRPVFWIADIMHKITGKYWLAANNNVIRKDVFFSVGGYRSVVCEDNDLMKRLPPNKNVIYDDKLIAVLSDRRFKEGGFFRTILLWSGANVRAWFGRGMSTKGYR
jgi:glycosyltransferase involved in cell wall biosynthesis